MDLLDNESPNIYITSPTSTTGRFPPPLSMNLHSIHGLNSPTSSPTAADFPSHNMHSHHGGHGSHPLSRQHSYQHMARGDSSSSTPLPSSPGSITMELFDDGSCDPPSGRTSTKRQRLDESGSSVSGPGNGLNISINSSMGGVGPESNMSMMSSVSSPGGVGASGGLASLSVPKKSVRARSDSAPLGYVTPGMHSWAASPSGLGSAGLAAGGMNSMGGAGRPRSGSGMVPRVGVPNIGNMSRNNGQGGQPLLSISGHGESGMNR
ncbi:hypothetical protein CPB83DRAFT_288718 [Crepidotus variabilis]|uniref:Uncharacterized protein n=1 Tax=Crepidotus variabilis TaxID=179855 RepID=A0A9P6JQM7_9AGAR|nr:hypothetical protein CPB83DRAFT_288718 [Crepidotus variabilis]